MKVRFTILGCGSSLGVPRIDGHFGNCNPKIIKNYRTRCSALIQTKYSNTLIDTSPDLRKQLIRQYNEEDIKLTGLFYKNEIPDNIPDHELKRYVKEELLYENNHM